MAGHESVTRVKLAAVQVRSEPGQPEANWAHAAPFIEQAAVRGAGLVVLPELFSCGYVANRAIRDMCEARNGGTARWLAATAGRLGSYLVAAVAMDPGRQHYQPQPSFGGWLQPGPALARKVVIPPGIASGTRTYSLSRDRGRKARRG